MDDDTTLTTSVDSQSSGKKHVYDRLEALFVNKQMYI